MEDVSDIFEPKMAAGNHEDQWISLSDLMTSLMMIFMLLAIAFMLKTEADSKQLSANAVELAKRSEAREEEAKKIEEAAAKMEEASRKIREDYNKIQQIAVVYDQVKTELYNELNNEFARDLPAWGAAISKDLSIQFKNESVLFDRGKYDVKPSFQAILQDFFPRYLRIITSPKYRDSIQEIRIEGHTSSVWGGNISPQEAYFKNMELSQARTRSTLYYLMSLPQVQSESAWLRKYVTANGLSSSHPILGADGRENELLSQRVEFRIRTDAEVKINNILKSVQ